LLTLEGVMHYIDQYKDSLSKLIADIDIAVVDEVIKKIDDVEFSNNKIYLIGNGGSAATASHMQNDLGVGLKRRGLLHIDIVSLCDNMSVVTALANDIGYDNIFVSQIENKISENDLLIAISCSGNSSNIIKAVKYANNIGSTVVGMTGFDGGQLKSLSDISYHVETKKNEYGLVEDLHMMLNHMIYTYYIKKNEDAR